MTQPPPTPGQMAAVDQVTADANRFLDSILTGAVTELQKGLPQHRLVHRIGGGLIRHEVTPTQLNVLASIGAARLAVLHHAIEQLADVHDANGMPNAAEELRKLVDQ